MCADGPTPGPSIFFRPDTLITEPGFPAALWSKLLLVNGTFCARTARCREGREPQSSQTRRMETKLVHCIFGENFVFQKKTKLNVFPCLVLLSASGVVGTFSDG